MEIMNLLHLNDDCLLHICSYLNIFDLISLSDVSQRFQMICQMIYRKTKRFDFNSLKNDKKLTTDEVKIVCVEIGEYVRELNVQAVKFATPNRILLETIFERFTNIKNLKLEGFIMKKKYLMKFFDVFVQLKSIEFRNCPLSDYFVKILEETCVLREIKFTKNFQFSGTCLASAESIEKLSLENCKNISPMYFMKFCCNKNSGLQFLNLKKCEWLLERNLRDIVEYFPDLEHLIVSNSYPSIGRDKLKIIGQLDYLKNLEIDFNGFTDVDVVLKELLKSKSVEVLDISSGPSTDHTFSIIAELSNLKVLKLNDKLDFYDKNLRILGERGTLEELYIAGCCNISNEELTVFVKNNKENLKLLDVSGCYGVTDYFIKSSLEVLHDRNDKLVVYVGGTQISEEIFLRRENDLGCLAVLYVNTYEPCEEVDYHIDDNSDDEENYMRLMRRGLLNMEMFTSDSDTENF